MSQSHQDDGISDMHGPHSRARWWKFDFHTHTPASYDFKERVTPETWLRKFMEKGIDCVAVTDHNSGAWIDGLRDALRRLRDGKPGWYRPFHLFPGVEITASGGVHVLAVLEPSTTSGDVDRLLDAVGYRGAKGQSAPETGKSVVEVIDAVAEAGAIPIPAHVDKENGLFRELGDDVLGDILDDRNVCAMELRDDDYPKPRLYEDRGPRWTEVRGSDTHGFAGAGYRGFTWIRMDDPPDLSGLKRALMNAAACVSRDMEAELGSGTLGA